MSTVTDGLAAAVCEAADGVYVWVHAQPGARKAMVRGMHGDAIKVAIREAAQDGRANAAILRLFADALGVAKSDVCLASGQTSRRKRLFVRGDYAQLMQGLQGMLDEG